MIEKIKELRSKTGISIAKCKEALEASGGDIEKAIVNLRKAGSRVHAKRSGRSATEGVVGCYIHPGAKICAIVEVNSETDFVAKNEEFQKFAHDLAMHVAAVDTNWVSRDEVPESALEGEREVIRANLDTNKPPEIQEKIIAGRLDKFYKENCLIEQPFVKNPDLSVSDLLDELVAKMGENIVIRRFERFEVGK